MSANNNNNNSSTLKSYVDSATGAVQNVVGSIIGSTGDEVSTHIQAVPGWHLGRDRTPHTDSRYDRPRAAPSSKRLTTSTTHPTLLPSYPARQRPRRASPKTTPIAPPARGTRRPGPPRSLSAVSSAARYVQTHTHNAHKVPPSQLLTDMGNATELEAVRARAEPVRPGAGGSRTGQGLHVRSRGPRVRRGGQRRGGPDRRPREADRVPGPARRGQDAAAWGRARYPEAG